MKLAQKAALGVMRTKLRLLQSVSPASAGRSAFDLFCTPMRGSRRKPGPYFEDALKLEKRFNDYLARGYRWPGTNGKKALVIHGFHSSVLNFEYYIRSLNQAGYEVIAFDAPAHGQSTGNRINALIYRDFLLSVFNEHGPFDLCSAHSFGGLALAMALAELPAESQPSRVALIAPATSSRTAMNQFFGMLQLDPGRYTPLFEQRIWQLSGQTPEWFSVTRAFTAIHSLVLWVHDEHDQVTPYADTAPVREANYPNLQFVSTTGLGHRQIYKDPEIAGMIIRFLTENNPHAPSSH